MKDMVGIFSLIILLLSAASPAFAESLELEPVKETSLKLLGRGIENRQTDENIALACIGDKTKNDSFEPGCDTLRFVYYKNANEVYFVGQTYHVESMSFESAQDIVSESVKSERVLYKTVKSREVFNYETASSEDQLKFTKTVFRKQSLNYLRAFGLTAGTGVGLAGLMIVGAPGVAILLGVGIGGYFIGRWFDKKNDRDEKVVKKHRIVRDVKVKYFKAATTEVFNRDGWNWASDPDRISDRKFSKILEAIQVVHAVSQ